MRFHGRGGHGVKTSSRILGTAAFHAGFQVQDFPIYGAERRGAPVVAFTRFDTAPILERGPIAHPDLVLVADETLVGEPSAGVLTGAAEARALFVNAAPESDHLAAGAPARDPARVRRALALDLTSLAMAVLGRAASLSAGLAAAAARLSGVVELAAVERAIRAELIELGVRNPEIDANVTLARRVFAELPAIEAATDGGATAPPPPEPLVRIAYEGPIRGAPSILAAGNAVARHTGSWRVERPEIDRERCNACGLCFVRCPDGAVALDDEGYPVVDYDHCKGCLVCAQICPLDAVARRREVRAW
ncbi:MAG: 2-oxoacid:acceptor oxidoreductase family protein [bacterium]